MPHLDLSRHGLEPTKTVLAHAAPSVLVELALQRGEGQLADNGAFMAVTAPRCSRSPKDKYIVREPETEAAIAWGKVNAPLEPAVFDRLLAQALAYANHQDLFVHDGYVCADPAHRLTLRVVAERAWHALFAQCLFRRLTPAELGQVEPEWLILALPELQFDAKKEGLNSEAAIVVSLARKTILIAGTRYAGEIKKSIFTILNALLPFKGVLSMHCSANIGANGDTALFFGLSGTGKTTLSADPERQLIGDDEHGWSDAGVFNIEGGCYAKTIRLSAAKEPQIYAAIRFGSVLENVPLDPVTRTPDYNSLHYTENTRAAYPLDFIPNHEVTGCGGHPQTIFFLTCDAFGVLPPISRLSPDQAMEHFLCGYTAKVAGTELGVLEPQETFSACFGAPFLPLPPKRYAELLRAKLVKHHVPVWLINTGWTGGGPGVGKRFDIPHTRAMLRAALTGELERVPFQTEPYFGLTIPTQCPDVPATILAPHFAWADQAAYARTAQGLAARFREVYSQFR
jgi:phosphoenolpyruvate carboxykinase (ATP)